MRCAALHKRYCSSLIFPASKDGRLHFNIDYYRPHTSDGLLEALTSHRRTRPLLFCSRGDARWASEGKLMSRAGLLKRAPRPSGRTVPYCTVLYCTARYCIVPSLTSSLTTTQLHLARCTVIRLPFPFHLLTCSLLHPPVIECSCYG